MAALFIWCYYVLPEWAGAQVDTRRSYSEIQLQRAPQNRTTIEFAQ